MHPLDGARAKLDRAKQHLAALGRLEKRFWEDNEPRFEHSAEVLDGGRYFVARVYGLVDHPNPRLALIAGDAVHNMRSALDHLVQALVTANGCDPKRSNEFPIRETEPDDSDKRRKFKAKLAGMHPDDVKAIRGLQPYANPGSQEAAWLVHLDKLDNEDKHRVLLTRYTVGLGPNPHDPPRILWSAKPDRGLAVDYNMGALRNGDWAMRVPFTGVAAHVYLSGGLAVSFMDPEVNSDYLDAIRSYVERIVESFVPSFNR